MKRDTIRKILPWQAAISLIAVIVFCDPEVALADPVTGYLAAHWVAILISAAISAAQIGINYLFRPKPKVPDKNKLSGDIQLSNVGEDIPIVEVYGQRQADGLGGIMIGGTIVYASQIRKTSVPVPGGGGGKGGPRAPVGQEYKYYQDLFFVLGIGPLRVLSIKAGTDLLYSDFTMTGGVEGDLLEAEDAVLAGPVSGADAQASGGFAVSGAGTITLNNINQVTPNDRKFYVTYKNSTDIKISYAVNGGATRKLTLPDSGGLYSNVMVVIPLVPGSANTIVVTIPGSVSIDCFHVGYEVINPDCLPTDPNWPDCEPCFLSGMKDPNYVSPNATFDNVTLEVTGDTPTPCEQYNYQPLPDALGQLEVEITNAATIRISEGNATQLPDPVLETFFNAKYGLGSAPAYRHRATVMIQDFETTKWGGNPPNFVFLVEHKTANSLGKMYEIRAQRVGLDPADYDFTDLYAVPLRGYGIGAKQAPKRDMEILNRVFDVDVFQDIDGIVKGVIPDYSVVASIPLEELDVVEMSSSAPAGGDKKLEPVERTVAPDEMVPQFLDVAFINPQKNNDTGNVHALREVTSSDKKETFNTELVMLEVEAQKFANRDIQKMWAQKDPMKIKTFWKHAVLEPTQVIEVEDLDGSLSRMQVKTVQGLIPSVYEISGVSHDLLELAPRPFENAPAISQLRDQLPTFTTPPVVIGTIIDLANLRSGENVPGVYVAAALYDTHYRWQTTTVAWERDNGWERLGDIKRQATMGRSVTALADWGGGPGVWDDTNTVTIDLYYGDLESHADDIILDRNNVAILGNEIIAFGTATRDTDYPNRWVLSHLRREIGKVTAAHATNERFVLMNSAVEYFPLDTSEAGQTRNYAFLAGGQQPEDSLVTSFTWSGETTRRLPVYDTIDAERPTIANPPTIYDQDDPMNAAWMIMWEKPDAFGFWADNTELFFAGELGAKLDGAHTDNQTSLFVENAATLFPAAGTVLVGSELVSYTAIVPGTPDELTGCTRGFEETTAAAHADNDPVRPIVRRLGLGNVTYKTEPKLGFDCYIAYRWRNRNRTEVGNGWSLWSDTALAYGRMNPNSNTPYSEIISFDNDPTDGSSPEARVTKWKKDDAI